MQVKLILTGKTDKTYLREGVDDYKSRIARRIPFKLSVLPAAKKTGKTKQETVTEKEGEKILSQIDAGDFVILLDEKGGQLSSIEFAGLIEKKMAEGKKNIIFVIGGPYGFHEKVRQRAQMTLSLSKMTLSHQIARLIFMEQLYRAITIIKGEPYHNE